MRKFFRVTYSGAVITLFLAAAVVGFTQTKIFRSWLRTRLVNTVTDELHGELILGSIEGNLFTGFHADSVTLREGGVSIISVERLEAKYDPLGLLTRSVSVSRLSLIHPVISLSRNSAGSWNFARLFQSESPDTTRSAWTIDLKQVQITGGILQLMDSLRLGERASDTSFHLMPGQIDFADVQVDSLTLDAAVQVRPQQIGLTLRTFECRSAHPELRVRNLAGEFLISPTAASAKKLRLETLKSHIRLDAEIDSVNVMKIRDLAQLQHAPVAVHGNVERLDFGELKQFIGSPIRFLDRDVAGQIDLEGRFGMVDVRNVTLRTGSSVIRIVGTIANLHVPRDLELDLACVKNRIEPSDVRRLMPGLEIPDLSSLGIVDYDLRFKGRPTAFNAKVTSISRVGRVELDGSLDLRESPMSYDATVRTSRLNLAPVVGDSAYTGNLNLTATIQGRGTRLSEMTALVRATIDSSVFYRLPIGRSVAVVDIADATIRPRVSLRVGSSRVDLGGTLEVHPRSVVSYEVSGRINSFNIADLTRKSDEQSDISFDLQAQGEYRTSEALSANLKLNVFRSSIDTIQFEGGSASANLNTLGNDVQTLDVKSDILDLDVRGHFSPRTAVSTLSRGAALIGEAVRYRITSLDSLRGEDADKPTWGEFRSNVPASHDSTDYDVTLNVKDCYPFGVVLTKGLDGQLTVNGHVHEGGRGIRFDGKASVPEFSYADRKTRLSMANGNFTFNVEGLSQTNLLESMGWSVGLRAKRFDIGGLHTANVAGAVTMQGDSSRYEIEGLIDSLVSVRAEGIGLSASHVIALNLALLRAEVGSYALQNAAPVRLKIGRDGIQVLNLQLSHEAENISVVGYFDPGGNSDLQISADSLQVSNIPGLVRRANAVGPFPATGGVLNAVSKFEGTFEEPRFSLDLSANGVRYENQAIGRITIRSSYADRLLNLFAQLNSHPDSASLQPDLLLNGTVPYDLSLSGESERKLEGEMNLDVRSSDFHLALLDPLIPEVSNLNGILICDMKLRGTVDYPSYEGSVTLQQARFLFNPLGIQYIVDGKLVPRGTQIAFQDMTIRNLPEDRADGRMSIAGAFALEALKIKDFNITANGQLLVMKETSRRASQGLYGDLFVGTGPDGIRWVGNPGLSSVSGGVLVKYANLTLPPTRQAEDLPNSSIQPTVINDTGDVGSSKTAREEGGAEPRIASSRRNVSDLVPSSQKNTGRPPTSGAAPDQFSDAQLPASKSFLENIVYNLTVETQGVTQLRFIFSNFTNEQLLAELKGKTVFTKDQSQMRLTGELDLGNRSFYNNYKKLDATGKLKFTGDPLNPELDIVASYEGVHRDTSTTHISGAAQKVIVKVFITGTREQPKVTMGLEKYDQAGNLLPQETGDVTGDAIGFLVTGAFPSEFTQQDKLSLAGSNVLGGVASSILSGPLTDLLRREFGVVRSLDVLYYGDGSNIQESADVRLTAEVGDAVVRFGGRILTDINNTNVSIQFPMSSIVGSEKWRNLVLEAERTVEGVETIDQRRESRGLKLLYRIIF